ncbi:MAG: RNA polymerase sigma factor [Pirellulaceae bacterium]
MQSELQESNPSLAGGELSAGEHFEQLLTDHGSAVLATLRRLCGSSHDAEDLFQETATRVWRHLQRQPEVRHPRAWLLTVAYRVFVDGRSRRQHRAEVVDPADSRQPPPDRRAEVAEENQRLARATAELPETLRGVIVLHYAGGLTLRETAAAIGISEGTVKSRLNAALAKLRSSLR